MPPYILKAPIVLKAPLCWKLRAGRIPCAVPGPKYNIFSDQNKKTIYRMSTGTSYQLRSSTYERYNREGRLPKGTNIAFRVSTTPTLEQSLKQESHKQESPQQQSSQ